MFCTEIIIVFQLNMALKRSPIKLMGCTHTKDTEMFDDPTSPVMHSNIYELTCVYDGDGALKSPLYIGALQDALNTENLLRHGINHVVNCGGSECTYSKNDTISYFDLPLADTQDEKITPKQLHGLFKFLKAATDRPVLFHCYLGKSRSVTLVLATLILLCNMTFNSAYSLVRQRRPGINPNIGFIIQLYNMERHFPEWMLAIREKKDTVEYMCHSTHEELSCADPFSFQ